MAYSTTSTTASYSLFSVSPSSSNAFAIFSMNARSHREYSYISPYYELVRDGSHQSESSIKSGNRVFGRTFGGI